MQKIHLYIIVLAFALGACQESEFLTEGDFFHLSNKGAKIPIWVQGNLDSDVILFTVHGGPGDAGMAHHVETGFQLLEEDYLLVYWDQRFSGMTQGRYSKDGLHPDQFIEDLEKVVDLVRSKYPDKQRFMIGHSWGGQLSAGYLGRDNHAELFKGWIDLDGSIYAEMETQLMKEWILEKVPAEMAKPDANLEFWQVILDFYEENPNPGNYSAAQPYWYVSALHGDVYDIDKYYEEFKIPYAQLIFKSMFSMSYYNDSFYEDEVDKRWDNINYTPELAQITIPALMLWGAYDGIVPPKVADYVYEQLGTKEAYKHIVKIPECGHGPQVEHPERFYDEVSGFIETYKD